MSVAAAPSSETIRPRAAARPEHIPRHHHRWALSYRASLLLSLSLLVIGTGVAMTLLVVPPARSSTTALAQTLFQEVSDHAVTRTRGFLLRAVPIAQSLANLSGQGLATADPDQLARQLTAFLLANPGVTWVSFSDEAGSFVGAYRTSEGALRVNQSHIIGSKTHLKEYDVAADGSWKLHRDESDSQYDPRTRPFYRPAKAAGGVIWPPPYIFYEQGVPGITCASPVYDGRGGFVGVLTVDFDLNTLSQFVQRLSLSPNSRLFIMSSDGILLAHPTQRLQVRAGQREKGTLMSVTDVDDPLIHSFVKQLNPDDRAAGPGGDRARQFEFEHAGRPYFARVTAFSIDANQTWLVGAMAPRDDFLASVSRANAISLMASLLALVIAVALASVLARRVSQPLVSLVIVPVLSKAIARTRLSSSSAAPPLKRMPWRAALLMALMSVTGVLMTSAQGQATTSSARAR